MSQEQELGRDTPEEDIETTARALAETVERLRAISSSRDEQE